MHECAKNFNVTLSDVSDQTGMLALQGPLAEALLAQVADADLAALPFHGVMQGRVVHTPAIVARTGYTGEDGFEIFVAAGDVTRVWDELLDAGRTIGLKPCGLGARDSLRFEACLALYGHEITEETNPYEARLGWVVKLDKGDFIGREALQRIKQEGVARRLTGFEMAGRGIARSEYEIRDLEGAPIGRVTSGMPSPTLGKNLGMGYVPVAFSTEGSEFDVVVRDRPVRARAVRMPFYRPRYKKG
jgi:aminomethyltransferase